MTGSGRRTDAITTEGCGGLPVGSGLEAHMTLRGREREERNL